MILSRYCKIYPHREDPDSLILFSTKTASIITVPESMIEEIEKGNISEEEKETLLKLGFLVNDADEESEEMLVFMDELNVLNKKFSAILVMNLDCNLACRYCFEGSRKGRFYMTQETADLFIDFVKNKYLHVYNTLPSNPTIKGWEHTPAPLSRGDFSSPLMGNDRGERRLLEDIKITFYGGEPLLSTELIIYLSERLKSLAEDKNIKYSASLITNGTLLTRNVVEKLKPLGLKIASITLDGPKEVHDQFRPFKPGKGTFDAIVRNINEVCDIIDVQLGGNFTQENYREFPFLLDYLMDNGLTPDKIPYVKFDPVFKESKGIAPPDFHEGCGSINEPWLFDAGIFLREEILKRGYCTQKIMPSPCMMELKDNLVVNYEGSFYKCPGLIGRERFMVGDLNTGIEEYRMSHNLDNWRNEECLNCSYLPLCFGGCRYMKLVQDGDINGVACKRLYFDETLKAFIYQDIESR
jgi:uncharacterized protein